ncbi:MAG: hypothetical protein IJA61_03405 [Clostridia bacterium]|nr:hypothetical protein [Clostridia bacterium]
MKNIYNDYPEHLNDEIVEKLNLEYAKSENNPTFLNYFRKEQSMKNTNILQEENPNNIQPTPNNINENYRLYSLISSNYCSLINLVENTISKTSSSKKEMLQRISATLQVDRELFNEQFFTSCSIERYTFCNYNQLIYRTIEAFIDLTENLSNLVATPLSEDQQQTANRLKNNSFDIFREYIQLHPFRV